MKALEFKDVEPGDSLQLTFEGTFEPRLDWDRALTPFCQALEEHAGEWMPDLVEGRRRRKYTRDALWTCLLYTSDAADE